MHRVEADVGRLEVTRDRAVLMLSALILVACSGGSVDAEPGFPATSSATGAPLPSSTPTISAEAVPAVQAYEAFNDAARNAARHPYGKGDVKPAGADFTRYTWDPFRGEYTSYIWGLAEQGLEYRGTPPTPHITVTSVELKAKPWPTVTLSDCQTNSSNWNLYNAKTGAVQPRASQKVRPPYRSTVTMIRYKKQWGVQKITLDSSRTCTV
jgi:hypothetical protein